MRARRMIVLGCLMLGFLGVAQSGEGGAPLDPVVADVVRMLEAGVDPGVVANWVRETEAKPESVAADDVIALTNAKAPTKLIELLVRLSAEPAAPSPEPRATEAPAPPPAPRQAGPVAGEATTDGGAARLDVTLDYKPDSNEFQEPWVLFLYVDGRPLASTRGGSAVSFAFNQELEFGVTLEPGRHVIGLLQERHMPISKKEGRWDHEARAFPRPISFEVPAGAVGQLALEVDERVIPGARQAGPVSWKLMVNGEQVAGTKDMGPMTSSWPALCEEVESGYEPDERDRSSFRRAMRGCLRWDNLFPNVEGLPTREQVRGELEKYDFAPVPASLR